MTPNSLNIPTRLNHQSILLLEDGFCFCTPNQKSFHPYSDFGSTCSESVVNFVSQQKELSTLQLVLLQTATVLVPALIFKETLLPTYWDAFDHRSKDHELQVQGSTNGLVKFIYQSPTPLYEKLTATSIDLSVVPAYAFLYDRIMEQSKNDFSKQIYVHLFRGYFDLFVTQGTRVLLSNRFLHQNEEDFMYYLFYVTEQLELAENRCTVFFLGKYNSFDTYYRGIEKFQKEIHFLDTHSTSPLGNQDPAPYWHA